MSAMEPMKMNARKIIARRCAMELKAGAVVNLGIGMPEGVANIVAEEGIEGMVLTTESGTIGGVPASGGDFGVTTDPDTIASSRASSSTSMMAVVLISLSLVLLSVIAMVTSTYPSSVLRSQAAVVSSTLLRTLLL